MEKDIFLFEEVEKMEAPCVGCFWGGCATIIAAVAIIVT